MSERSEIARDGMKAQKNSGRGQIQKGDATLGDFLVDIKEYSKSFSVSKSVWAKICSDSWKSGRLIPALKLVLGDKDPIRLWVIEDAVFHEMRKAWEEKNVGTA